MPYRSQLLMLAMLSLLLQAESCWYPGPGGIAQKGGDIIDDPDEFCTELPGSSLPGIDFVPDSTERRPLWVVNTAPQGLLAFDPEELPPTSWVPSRDVTVPQDSDKNGEDDSPAVNGLRIESATLGLITAQAYDEVLFFDPTNMNPAEDGGLDDRYQVSIPGGGVFVETDYPLLPDPVGSVESRPAVSTKACVPAADSPLVPAGEDPELLSGDPLVGTDCAGTGITSFYSSVTTGATVIADANKLFVSMSNPAPLTTPAEPFYRPGVVLVYDFLGGAVSPSDSPPAHPSIVFTRGFNPTDVVGYNDGSKNYILAIVSGVIPLVDGALEPDDRAGSFVELIDADASTLVSSFRIGDQVAEGEGGDAALSGVSALDATNGMLYVGSAVERTIYSIVLSTLITPPAEVHELNLGSPSGISLPDDCDGSIRGMAISDDGSEVYAVDYCAGTLIVLGTNGTDQPTQKDEFALTFPINESDDDPEDETDAEGDTTPAEPSVKLKGPTRIAVRPGNPDDYDGSDLFVLVTEPEGRVCAQNVQAN